MNNGRSITKNHADAVVSVSAPLRLAEAPRESLANLKAVFSDLDDTLTHQGELGDGVVAALRALRAAGLSVWLITGRPAGWCDALVRLTPVDGVVGENGAFAFWRENGSPGLRRRMFVDEQEQQAARPRLLACAHDALSLHSDLRMASDQAWRLVDVAVDFAEDTGPLSLDVAEAVKARFQAAGFSAAVSSIHVNAWFGPHTKASAARSVLADITQTSLEQAAFVGDSANDAPLFAAFPMGFGVANIARFLPLMQTAPAYVTQAGHAEGFCELASAILAARKGS